MPNSVTYPSAGTKIEVLAASPSTWLEITQSAGWDGPGNKLAFEDITNLSSDQGAVEKIPVTQEVNVISTTLFYDPANAAHAYLRASNVAPFPKPLETFRYTSSAPTPEVKVFAAYVSDFRPIAKAKTSAQVALELTPTGALHLAS